MWRCWDGVARGFVPSLRPPAECVRARAVCVCVCGVCLSCSLSCGVVFVSYALHARYKPYAVSEMPIDLSGGALNQAGVRIVYVCRRAPSATPTRKRALSFHPHNARTPRPRTSLLAAQRFWMGTFV
jgi:hypothetical protein